MPVRRRAVFCGIASFFVCAFAYAEPTDNESRARTSVALLGGYGVQLDTLIRENLVSSYGPGMGARWGVTLARRFYVGGTFVTHLGTLSLASDTANDSTYRGSYHRSYFGPEVGLDVHAGPVLLRPWIGTGAVIAIERTSVRQFQREDDALRFYVQPGFLGGIELDRWLVGLDLRIPIVPAEEATRWAPTLFFVLGRTM
jgi:hypothetical protein